MMMELGELCGVGRAFSSIYHNYVSGVLNGIEVDLRRSEHRPYSSPLAQHHTNQIDYGSTDSIVKRLRQIWSYSK